MSQEKYIGMDVHQATISVMVAGGKLIMECLLGGWPTSRQRHCARGAPFSISGVAHVCLGLANVGPHST
jgi:hypothetical protein